MTRKWFLRISWPFGGGFDPKKRPDSLGEVGIPHLSMETIKTKIFEAWRTTFDAGI
jgi:hypothetical protein